MRLSKRSILSCLICKNIILCTLVISWMREKRGEWTSFFNTLAYILFCNRFAPFNRRTFMKVVIFAGGLGTRISEETDARPKPMVEVGGKPILWHIMKMYSQHGFNE